MNANYLYLSFSFITSMALGHFLIPAIINFCKKKKLYDIPNERKVHKDIVPRLGGICFMPCMVISSMLAVALFNSGPLFTKISISPWTLYFFIGLLLIYATGMVDDLIELSPRIKFAVQFFAATILPLSGLYINHLYGLIGINYIPFYIGEPVTVVIIVFIVNAINLIDGIDGLASGLSIIALLGFLCLFINMGMWAYGILIAGLLGVLVAFMRYNIFGRVGENKTFMGDTGSLTIGFILATLFIRYSMFKPQDTLINGNRILLSGSLLIVPVFDVFRVMLVRFVHHRNIFAADSNHLHHKILRAGFSQRQALYIILCIALTFITINHNINLPVSLIVCLDITIWIFIQFIINWAIKKNNGKVFC